MPELRGNRPDEIIRKTDKPATALVPLTTVTAGYRTPGLYLPAVTITDTFGNKYTDTAIVNVLSMDDMGNTFKVIWNRMRLGLAGNNISLAISDFSEETQPLYNDIFTALQDQLPEIAQNMQDIEPIYIEENFAKFRVRKTEKYGGQQITAVYYVYFTRGQDGLWKLYKY